MKIKILKPTMAKGLIPFGYPAPIDAGEVIDVPEHIANGLIDDKLAKKVVTKKPTKKPDPKLIEQAEKTQTGGQKK